MTLYYLPFPSLVTSFQLLFTVGFIFSAKGLGWLSVDPIKLQFVIPYSYYIIGFALGVYCNMRSLTTSNVETVIVAKALSPCLVSFLDTFFLGREYPSYRSWGAIALIGLGAFGYACHDEKFQTQGISAYFWPFCYLLTISFEMAYGKSLLKTVKMKTQSGPVLYTNLLGIWPMLLFATFGGEFGKYKEERAQDKVLFNGTAIALLALGSVAGTGIGYSSWWYVPNITVMHSSTGLTFWMI
jgi:GDP-mannose transporter